jgi:pimeloyl-ACP methyl ester carboxylesterase
VVLPRYRKGEFKVYSYEPASNTVVVQSTEDTLREMPLSLRADRGRFHAALTSQLDTRGLPDGQVRRKIGRIFKGDADAISDAWISGWCAEEPSDFGLAFEEVDMGLSETTSRPAWLIESSGGNPGLWTIHIHGRTAARQETIRSLQASVGAGVNAAAISYRAEGEARTSNRDRISTLGLTESDDVLLAMNWLEHKRQASKFILVGWSLGMVVAAEALRRDTQSNRIVGLVSMSGVVDVTATLRAQSIAATGSASNADRAKNLMAGRLSLITGLRQTLQVAGLGLAKLDLAIMPPALFLHSTDDHFVPIDPVVSLAARMNEKATVVKFDGGGHVKEWNSNPQLFAKVIREWLLQRSTELK